ncbi:MAG: hypothetical protein ACRCTP_04900 [Aeromonas popoffii]|uniref:hypothetical protein n=1 Tax=Aeromonas popoffii TaxID=70856 RepID=UPI003F2BA99A
MHNFKVGDIVNLNTNPTDKFLIEAKEGGFPRRVTSVSGEFVRFNDRYYGWVKAHFIKVGFKPLGAIGHDSPNAKADSQAGVVGPKPPTGAQGPTGGKGDKGLGKYDREIIGMCGTRVIVDVYRVLDAFSTQNPILDHLIKKALCAGLRGHKDRGQDLTDILHSAHKAVELHEQKEGK